MLTRVEDSSTVTQWCLSSKEVAVGKSAVMLIRATNNLANRKKRGIRYISVFKKMRVVENNLTVPQTDTGGQVE